MTSGFTAGGLARLHEVLAKHGDNGTSSAWLVARKGHVDAGAAGPRAARDTIFRISSTTKPIVAVAALVLVEECRLRLDDPVDELLPELADRRVLVRPDGPLDETVPADRPVTLRDLLTFRLGLGMDFGVLGAGGTQSTLEAMAARQLGIGPPAPSEPPAPDEWMRRLGELPLERQPGERWLYHTSAEVLGVLVARAAGQPLEAFLRERILDPLGMGDTAFSVPADKLDRFGPCHAVGTEVYDPPEGQWSAPPAFPSGGGGLVSTVDDLAAFAELLLAGGTARGVRVLSRPTIEAMTTDQLTADQRAASGPDPSGAVGWGLGIGVHVRRTGPAWSVGAYGWDGGLGSTWVNDPAEGLVGVCLTDRMFTSPAPPAAIRDFWTCTYAAVAD